MIHRMLAVAFLGTASFLVACNCGCVDEPVVAAPTGSDTSIATDITPVTLTWEVNGMHCGGCAAAIKGKIAALNGVASCDVSFEESKAVVVADPTKTAAIESAMTGLGYTITAQQ